MKSVDNNNSGNIIKCPMSLMAIMDIMGFSSMLENNGDDTHCQTMAQTVLKCLEKVEIAGRLGAVIKRNPAIKSQLKAIENERKKVFFTQFSDTSVFVMPNVRKGNTSQLLAFFLTISCAVEQFYKSGLPVKCRIESGDCLYNEQYNILFGSALSFGHHNAENMDYSGVEISEAAMKTAFGDSINEMSIEQQYGIRKISVPKKDGRWTLDYSLIWHESGIDDIKQELLTNFTMHKKGLNSRVVEIINNTETTIRQLWI